MSSTFYKVQSFTTRSISSLQIYDTLKFLMGTVVPEGKDEKDILVDHLNSTVFVQNSTDLSSLLSGRSDKNPFKLTLLKLLYQALSPDETQTPTQKIYEVEYHYSPTNNFNEFRECERVKVIQTNVLVRSGSTSTQNKTANCALLAKALYLLQDKFGKAITQLHLLLKTLEKPFQLLPNSFLKTNFQTIRDSFVQPQLVTDLENTFDNFLLELSSNSTNIVRIIESMQSFLDNDVKNALFYVSALSAAIQISSQHFTENALQTSSNRKWLQCVEEEVNSARVTDINDPRTFIKLFYNNIVCYSLASQLCTNTSFFFTDELTNLMNQLVETTVERDKQLFEHIKSSLPILCTEYKGNLDKEIACQLRMAPAIAIMEGVSNLMHVMKYSREANVRYKRLEIVYSNSTEFLDDFGAHVVRYSEQNIVNPTWFQTITSPFKKVFQATQALVLSNPLICTTLAIVVLGAYGFYQGVLGFETMNRLFVSVMDFFAINTKTLYDLVKDALNISASVPVVDSSILKDALNTSASAVYGSSVGIVGKLIYYPFYYSLIITQQIVYYFGKTLFWDLGVSTYLFWATVVQMLKYPWRYFSTVVTDKASEVLESVKRNIPYYEESKLLEERDYLEVPLYYPDPPP